MAFQPAYGIIFDKPHNTYFAGETVTGRVEIIFDKPTEIKGILLRIKGEAQVLWQETVVTNSGGNRRTTTVTYTANEEYLKAKFYCIGGNDGDKIPFNVGKYVYPFSFILPETLPSSFEGKFGSIRYTAKMTMERPWKWNKEIKVAFTVVTPYNLNLIPNLAESSKASADKYFCCLCCKSGPLTSNVLIPKSGYVSGERIPVIVEIDNASNVKVVKVNLRFEQYIEYHATSPKGLNREIIEIEKFKLGPVNPRQSQSWSRELLIPPLPPSNLSMCSIIVSQYRLFLEVSVNMHLNLKSILPITIGTVPLMNSFSNAELPGAPPAPPPDYETAIASGAGTGNYGWSNYPTAPVATFSENTIYEPKSIQDSEDNKYTNYDENAKAYRPYYPTYNFNEQQ